MADDNRDRPGLRLRIFGILARNCTAPDLDASPLPPAHVTADLGCRVLIDDVDPGEPERGVLRGAAPGRSPGCEWRWWAERPGQAVHRPRCPQEIEQTHGDRAGGFAAGYVEFRGRGADRAPGPD